MTIQIDAYLFFDGNCAEAMRTYQRVLGGELELLKFDDGPPGSCPDGAAGRIMHACLTTGGRRLMASDTVPKYPHQGNHGFAVCLSFPTVEEARRVFDALAEGGKVNMPLEKTFWVDAFGMVADRFGIPWMINGGETR